MAGPLIQAPEPPGWLDPRQASVTDPLWKTLLRKAAGMAGVGDPEGTIMQGATGSPLISIYSNKGAREMGTHRFIRAAMQFPQALQDAFGEFATKYPRIAAHLNPKMTGPEASAAAYLSTPYGPVKSRMVLGITPMGTAAIEGASSPELAMSRARDYVFHEGTHGAQALGNSKQAVLYDHANTLLGYGENPFELAAQNSANRATYGNKMTPFPKATDLLGDMTKAKAYWSHQPGQDALSRDEVEAASEIYKILKKRAENGWKPSK